jgi:ATP-dependent Clp protease, protease subunit
MNRIASTWPPRPPQPPLPEPPQYPPPSPWRPEPRPSVAPAPSMQVVVAAEDRLAERLLEQRVVALAGDLDDDAVNRTVAALALLDATGHEPIALRLSSVGVDLDAALTLVDALDLVGAPVHATALGTLTGPAVALLAVADVRVVAPHAAVHLTEPRTPRGLSGREVETAAAQRARQLRRLQERLAEACGQDVEQLADDMRAGRVLSAEEARAYGLADPTD